MRLLVTQFPQQQFNATLDRKAATPDGMKGVACFDCHVNGHTVAATHLVGDIRPQSHRRRIDTVSLRGLNVQRHFGSQRAMKTVEDFTQFEQLGAYFDGDPLTAIAKGMNILDRSTPGPLHGRGAELPRLPAGPGPGHRRQAQSEEIRRRLAGDEGPKALLRQGPVRHCHPAPYYTDNSMHNLQWNASTRCRTINGMIATAQGPIKTFTLRGIKESPPYLHDGRLLTLEDTVEFFNIVLETQLTGGGKDGPGGVHAAALIPP